ncbi:TPA: hypothetical protein ACXHW4_004254 [Enterobacter hormaechei]
MTTKVTKESLAENIGRLESYGDLSLNEEYQLKAYRLLIDLMPKECQHKWRTIEYSHARELLQCSICGKMKEGQGNY